MYKEKSPDFSVGALWRYPYPRKTFVLFAPILMVSYPQVCLLPNNFYIIRAVTVPL